MLMFPKKNITLKQYTLGTLQNMLTSQFIYSNLERGLMLKNLNCQIQTRKHRKIDYFYLWLITNQIPSLRKFYPSWKNNSKNTYLKPKMKNHSVNVLLKPKKKFNILNTILIQMISKQTNSEKKFWTFQKNLVWVKIALAPLTKSTSFLQMKNTYFPNISMRLQFHFSNATAFQKIYFLRALNILTFAQIPALDDVITD